MASFDPAYLNQTILAMKKLGHPNRFEYLCVHPHEIADGLGDVDGEVHFLWLVRTLRDMLMSNAPERTNAEIWITEVGHRIEKKAGRTITEKDAAKALAKIYTMSLAQGIACTQWFEAQDPICENQGFGLLNREEHLRPCYCVPHGECLRSNGPADPI